MQKKTLEIIYDLQAKRKPNFFNYIISFKSIFTIIIFFIVSKSFNYTAGFFIIIFYFWWDLPRTELTYSMKITNKKNLKYILNNIAKTYYKENDNLIFKQILANKVLNPKDKK